MSVIGIISNSNNIIELENKFKNELNEKNIIGINEKSLKNFIHIKFDIIVIYNEMENTKVLKEIIKNSKYLIINTDFKENLSLLDDEINSSVITFGFNSKSTITIVSNENEEIILDVQREIENYNGKKIECQEVKIDNNCGKSHIYEEVSMKILTFLAKI